MTADPYVSQQAILALLRTIPHVEVFEGGVPDDVALTLTASGKIAPHLVLSFAGLTEPSKGTNGIAGAAQDSFTQTFSIEGIGGDKDAALQVHRLAWLKVLGYVPANCGEVRPAFFAGIGKISSLSTPTRFSAAQAYRYLINA